MASQHLSCIALAHAIVAELFERTAVVDRFYHAGALRCAPKLTRHASECATKNPEVPHATATALLACDVAIPRVRLQACRVSARRARGRCAFAVEVRCAGYYFESAALKSAERQTIARRFAAQALMHP